MSRGERNPNKLYRDPKNGKLAGVCAGLADYFSTSAFAVRCIAVCALIIYTVPTIIAYVIAALALDRKPESLYRNHDDEEFWRSVRRSPKDTLGSVRMKFRDLDRKIQAMETYLTSKKFSLDREFDRMKNGD